MCYKECRRLLASSMFDRRIDANYLRAMCIASYWLSDISWEVSGCAIRRAAEFNLIRHFKKATEEGNEDSADYVRLWYVLHICDQHLSTLYGRQPIIREDLAIQGWKTFMTKSPPQAASEDTRLASQVALVNIIHTIRDLFGPDTGDPVPQVYSMQIAQFARQLDQWVGHWSGVVTGMLGSPIIFTDSTLPVIMFSYMNGRSPRANWNIPPERRSFALPFRQITSVLPYLQGPSQRRSYTVILHGTSFFGCGSSNVYYRPPRS